MKLRLTAMLLACALLAACGTPGAPQPPSLELPTPVTDLAVTRVGDKVTLTWTPPQLTTDGATIRHPGPTRICRSAQTSTMVQCAPIGTLPASSPPAAPNAKPTTVSFTDTLPVALQQQDPLGAATYAVEVANDRGHSAGLSNQVPVPLAPTLAPPASVEANVTENAIVLSWRGGERPVVPPQLAFDYHVFRQSGAAAEVDLGEAAENGDRQFEFADRNFEWQQTYTYHVAAITTVIRSSGGAGPVLGTPSAPVTIEARDVFPPTQPGGVQAVASGVGQAPFIDLTWAPDTESDLAGYNVYRREDGGAPVKITAELVKAPAYRDAQVQRGHKYFYSVSAVDLRGNESARSAEASETVP